MALGTVVSLRVKDEAISEIIEKLSSELRTSGRALPITIAGGLAERVPLLELEQVPLREALDRLCDPLDLSWEAQPGGVVVRAGSPKTIN